MSGHVCPVRSGQNTDAPPAVFVRVGAERCVDPPFTTFGLWQCSCGQLWAADSYLGILGWSQASYGDRPRWKQTFNDRFVRPEVRRRRRWRS